MADFDIQYNIVLIMHCLNLMSLSPLLKSLDVPTEVGLYWHMGAILARCPSFRHQWFLWV